MTEKERIANIQSTMTLEKAIDELEYAKRFNFLGRENVIAAINVAQKELECRTPKDWEARYINGHTELHCPCCGRFVAEIDWLPVADDYCTKCGQKWSKNYERDDLN